MSRQAFWDHRKVFITGHTGFKASWLTLWLHSLGAVITGYALPPPTNPSLFVLCGIEELLTSIIADVRDQSALTEAVTKAQPEIVFHLAAQPLVRYSYINPVETFETNVMGTVNLLEAIRSCESVKAVVNITTDKCYQNNEWYWGYRENDPLGGYDPYSASKGCSEVVTSSYRNSFFNKGSSVALASARAGNVIGGGDWAEDRLIPDCIKSLLKNDPILIRNPEAIRPWQHVLEPLNGYLMLAEQLHNSGSDFAEAWNFGPDDRDVKPVRWIVETLCRKWGGTATYNILTGEHPHEARYLKLECSKARQKLGWQPRWELQKALEKVIEWTVAYKNGLDMRKVCLDQIRQYNEEIC